MLRSYLLEISIDIQGVKKKHNSVLHNKSQQTGDI